MKKLLIASVFSLSMLSTGAFAAPVDLSPKHTTQVKHETANKKVTHKKVKRVNKQKLATEKLNANELARVNSINNVQNHPQNVNTHLGK